MTPDPDRRTSVVVITHNRRAELAHSLQRLAELPERPPTVVVATDRPMARRAW